MSYDKGFIQTIAEEYANMVEPEQIAENHGISVDELYEILKDNRDMVEAACNNWERTQIPGNKGADNGNGNNLAGIVRALERIATALERLTAK